MQYLSCIIGIIVIKSCIIGVAPKKSPGMKPNEHEKYNINNIICSKR